MKKLVSLFGCLALTACATTGKSFEEKYNDNAKVVQICLFNTIVGVLSAPRTGLEGFTNLCDEKPNMPLTGGR